MCTCGNSSYAVRTVVSTSEAASRWRLLSTEEGGVYGRFELSIPTGQREVYCASCARVRYGVAVGGGIAMAYLASDTDVQVVMTDVVTPSCIEARLIGEGRVHSVSFEVSELELAIEGDALETASSAPAAVTARYVFALQLPFVEVPGFYQLVFADRCLYTTQTVATLQLLDALQSLYGRHDDVVALAGDYAASLVESAVPDVTVATALNTMQTALGARVARDGDLGGTLSTPLVVGIQGYPLSDSAPVDGAVLTFVSGVWQHST
jgi:hypothetical protein